MFQFFKDFDFSKIKIDFTKILGRCYYFNKALIWWLIDIIVFIGFTHNVNDKSDKRKLTHNINPIDNSSCYVKTKVEKQRYTKYKYDSKYRNYRLHNDDKKVVSSIIANDKRNKKKREITLFMERY